MSGIIFSKPQIVGAGPHYFDGEKIWSPPELFTTHPEERPRVLLDYADYLGVYHAEPVVVALLRLAADALEGKAVTYPTDLPARLLAIANHDWRTGILAHTSDTAREAAEVLIVVEELRRREEQLAFDYAARAHKAEAEVARLRALAGETLADLAVLQAAVAEASRLVADLVLLETVAAGLVTETPTEAGDA